MGIKGLKTHWVLELQKYSWHVLGCRRRGESGRRSAMAEPAAAAALRVPGLTATSVPPKASIHPGEAAVWTGSLTYWELSVVAEIPL